MSLEPTSLGPTWWTSLHHTGLLIAPPMVTHCFDADLDPQPAYTIETLRRAVTRRAEVGAAGLLDTVFLQVLGYDEKLWNRNPPADKWSHRLLTGESERPRRVYADSFPVFIERPEIRLGLGRGRQSVARAVEWLRKANLKLGLLATEQQWRLIYAGSDFDASCEWDLNAWLEAGNPHSRWRLYADSWLRARYPTAFCKPFKILAGARPNLPALSVSACARQSKS